MESLVNKQFSRKRNKKTKFSLGAAFRRVGKKIEVDMAHEFPTPMTGKKMALMRFREKCFFFSHGPWARSCFFDVDFERTFLFFFWGGILLAKLENKNATETNYNSNFLREGGIFSRNSLLRLDWIAVEPHV